MVDLSGGNQCKELALTNITWTYEDADKIAAGTSVDWRDVTTQDF
jgi:hypothetical protein